MKLHSFHELATRIAHLSTRDGSPISVTFGGKDAYTNGKHINLPALPAGTVLTPSQFSAWLGYILHEGPGHLSHTDMKLYINTVKTQNDPIFSSVLNILEDVRIENADIALYPGDRKYLDQTHHYVDSQIPAEKLHSPDPIARFYKSAFKYRTYDCPVNGESSPEILQALTALPLCKSTRDCIDLATIITQLLKDEKDQTNDDSDSNRSDSTQSGEHPNPGGKAPPSADGNGNLSENIRGDDNDSENEGGRDEESSGADAEANPNGSQDGTNDNPGNGREGTNRDSRTNSVTSHDLAASATSWQELTEIKNIIQQLVEDTNDKGSSHHTNGMTYFPPYDLSSDRIFVPSEENLSTYSFTRAELNSQILALKKMFRVYLQSQSKKSWLRGLNDGETIDLERLPAVATGQKSIFKSPKNRQLINTAVELMLDLSGSMNEDLVRAAAIILSEALSTIPEIKLSICGFETGPNSSGSVGRVRNIGRLVSMNILVFKNFNDPYFKCRARLGAIQTGGSTPLGEAYGKALEHLLPRPEPRKIILLVTDGIPEFATGDSRHSDFPLMDQIHNRAQKLKIETLGLGIGYEVVAARLRPYVDQCLNIEEIEALPQTLLQILKKLMRGQKS